MRAATCTPNLPLTGWNLPRARNLALFLLAPFIALAYVLAFPVVGLGMLAWAAIEK